MRTVAAVATIIVLLVAMTDSLCAQSSWTRSAEPARSLESPFHSSQAISLPTSTSIGAGMLLFEISHRFIPRFSDGHDALWGLDGPANIRFGLGIGLTDQVSLTLGRSNLFDNYDLAIKYRLVRTGADFLPCELALQAGTAWNTSVGERVSGDNRNFQHFVQAILNVGVGERVAVGVVPSYLHNYAIFGDQVEEAVTLGFYGNLKVTRTLSFLAEWNVAEWSLYFPHDAFGMGLVLETGGHFFKVTATNTTTLNTTSFLSGSEQSADPKNWHLGFLITRLIKL